ncbi:MAG: AAA family ATPase [Candidatus Paceibacterota bacterium]
MQSEAEIKSFVLETEQYVQGMEGRIRTLDRNLAETRGQLEITRIRGSLPRELVPLRDALMGARSTIAEQEELLARLTKPALLYATVLKVNRKAGSVEAKDFPLGSKVVYLDDRENPTTTTMEVMSAVNEDGYVTVFDHGSKRKHSLYVLPPAFKPVILIDNQRNPLPQDTVPRPGMKVKLHTPHCFGTRESEVPYNYYEKNLSVRFGVISEVAFNYLLVKTCVSTPFAFVYHRRPLQAAPESRLITTAVIALEGKTVEVLVPALYHIKEGDTVKVAAETMQIVALADYQPAGELASVREVVDHSTIEVEMGGSVRIVSSGALSTSLEKGDRIIVDPSGSVVIRKLPDGKERFHAPVQTVAWDDIGGLFAAKKHMKEIIELPYQNPAIYSFYKKKPVKGVLLYGPPGCGKTMLAKATVNAIASLHGADSADSGFIYVKGPEILDKYVGVAEATIRQIFQRARKHKEQHGYPAVIFIDEGDAILGRRGSGISSDIERTIVPAFLAEMDGLDETSAIVLIATNRPDTLDPAVVRDGRIDRKVRITRPDEMSAVEIFNIHLRGIPLAAGHNHCELAELGSKELFSTNRILYRINLTDECLPFTLGNLCNGGMIAGIVDQATSKAMHRDIERGTQGGLVRQDVIDAINDVFLQNLDLDHSEPLEEILEDVKGRLQGIQRVRVGAA